MALTTAVVSATVYNLTGPPDNPSQVYGVVVDMPIGESLDTLAVYAAGTKFGNANQGSMAEDHNGSPVFLARNSWHLKTTGEEWPDLKHALLARLEALGEAPRQR